MTAEKFNRMPSAALRTRGKLLGRTALCGVLSLSVVAAFAARPAKAEPVGGAVVTGGATIDASGAHTQITQTTQQALITWQDFSIGTAESVTFAQPNVDSVALNKVLSNIPSDIQGQLTANGQVWIINPNGVFVGAGATINVGGMVASTADLVQQDWDAGKYTFDGAPAGSEINVAGAVTATDGSIVLVAPVVDVSGMLSAQGDVALGAGAGFTVDFDGDGLTRFEVDAASAARLDVSGTISAQGGAAYLMAAATDAVEDAVVSVGGRVEATRVEGRGGVVVISGGDTGLTDISGTIDASQDAGAGGNVVVTGDRVAIRGTAVIDASGATDGGTVEIGGGFQGAALSSGVAAHSAAPTDSPLPTAKRVYVAEGAQITADAGTAGDGGTVIVWADEATGFYGSISAIGGAESGDGGFAEVSGKLGLGFDGNVDLTAAFGATGTLLLDPDNLTVIANNGTADIDENNVANVLFADDPGSDLTISDNAIENRNANLILQATETITVDAAIDDGDENGTNSFSVTMQANDIVINEDITLEGDLTLQAADDITIGNNNGNGGDDLTIGGDLLIAANTDLSGFPSGPAASGNGVISFAQGADISAADVTMLTSGAIALRDIITTGAGSSDGDFSLTAGGAVTQASGDIVVVGATSIVATTFDVTLDSGGNDFGGVVTASANTISLNDDNSIVLGDIDASGDLIVEAQESILDNDASAVGDGINVIGMTSLTAGVGFDIILDAVTPTFGGVHDFGGSVTVADVTGSVGGNNTIDNLALVDANTLTLANVTITTQDSIRLGATNISLAGLTLETNALTLQNTGGNIELIDDTLIASGGTTLTFNQTAIDGFLVNDLGFIASGSMLVDGVSFASTGNVELSGGGGITFQDTTALQTMIDFTGDLTLGTGAGISQTLELIVPGALDVTITQSGLNVFLNDPNNNFDSNNSGSLITASIAGTSQLFLDDSTGNVVLGLVNGGRLHLDANGGSISQNADGITLTGSSSFDALTTVTLTDPDNDFGTFSASGTSVAVTDTSSIELSLINSTGPLTVTADDDITDAFINVPGFGVIVTGTTSLTAGADGSGDNDITLVNPTNDFMGLVNAAAVDISFTDANGLTLGDIDAAGDLTVTAITGSIGDGAEGSAGEDVNVIGATTLTATTGNITLNDGTNDFGLGVTAGGLAVNLSDDNDIVLADIDATSLIVDADGSIDDGAVVGVGSDINVTTTSSLTAGTTITLDDTTNDFGGNVAASGTNITLTDVNLLNTGLISATGDVLLTATDIGINAALNGDTITIVGSTPGGSIVLGALSTTMTISDAEADRIGGDLTLATTGNGSIFLTGVSFNTAAGVQNVTLDTTSGVGSISVFTGANTFEGDLTLNSGGAITQNVGATLDVSGATDITAAGIVNLGLTGNNFTSVDASGTNISLLDANNIQLGVITASGSLTVNSTGGSISDTAGEKIDVGTTTNLDAAGTITLDNADLHDFVGSVDADGTTITLVDTNSIVLGIVDADGNLNVTATNGTITDTAANKIDVTGSTTLAASGEIALDNANLHDFDSDNNGGAVSADGTDITLVDMDSIQLGVIDADGNLSVTATLGNITDTAANMIDVEGSTTLSASGAIALDNANLHDFDSNDSGDAVSANGATVTLVDTDNIQLGDIEATTLTVTSVGGSITDGPGTAGGDLVAAFGGTSDVDVTGASSFTANSGITLDDVTNSFGGTVAASTTTGSITIGGGTGTLTLDGVTVTAGDLNLDTGGAVILGAITVGNDLNITSGGAIQDIDGKAITVSGDTSITAGTAANYFDVVLDSLGPLTGVSDAGTTPGSAMHDFNTVDVTGEDIVIRDKNDLTITATGSMVGGSDPTFAMAPFVISTGFETQIATITPNGSVVIQADDALTVTKVVADQDVLLVSTNDNIILPLPVAPEGIIPIQANFGDIWTVALNGSFADAAGPGANFVVPAGTTLNAPEGNIAIILKDAFRVIITESNETALTNPALDDPEAPAEPTDPPLDVDAYENTAFVLNTDRNGIALISILDGELIVGSQLFIDQIDAFYAIPANANEPFNALSAIGSLTSDTGDLFVATGNLALESRNLTAPGDGAPPNPNSAGFYVENTSSSIGAGSGARVIGATFVGGFWNGIGLFGTFNGVSGVTASFDGFITEDGGTPPAGRAFAPSADAQAIITNLGDFVLNFNNTVNGCIIGQTSTCSPIGRVILLLLIDDGSLLAFRFFDEEEEEDDAFSNRGDEEDWQ